MFLGSLKALKVNTSNSHINLPMMSMMIFFTVNNNFLNSTDDLPVTDICLGCICEASSGCNRTLTCNGNNL